MSDKRTISQKLGISSKQYSLFSSTFYVGDGSVFLGGICKHCLLVDRMNLTTEEHGLVVDYFFRCAEREQINRASILISSNPGAAEFYSCIRQALSQLEHMHDEDCPAELVDLTIARLKLATLSKSLPHHNDS